MVKGNEKETNVHHIVAYLGASLVLDSKDDREASIVVLNSLRVDGVGMADIDSVAAKAEGIASTGGKEVLAVVLAVGRSATSGGGDNATVGDQARDIESAAEVADWSWSLRSGCRGRSSARRLRLDSGRGSNHGWQQNGEEGGDGDGGLHF